MRVRPEDTARFIAEKRRKRFVGLKEREETARRDAAAIVAMVVEKYHPTRIYQWGSLTRRDEFREWSDIDIAVEGLRDPLDGLRAADDAAELTWLPVELIELDRIDSRHAETIRREGVLVYEREKVE